MGLGPRFSTSATPRLGEPQPHRFTIERIEEVGEHAVALIRYPDATEYGGAKVLLYRHTTAFRLRTEALLDPHFLEDPAVLSPFARFEATEAGFAAAVATARSLA